jgi:hypothetical protein
MLYMKNTEREAINNLNNLLPNLPVWNDSVQQIRNNVQILVQGINELDQEVKQKTFEVKNREQLLAQKDQILVQKEQKVGELQKTVFADSLHKLYPDSYPAKVEQWPDTLPMKKHVVNNDVLAMEKNTAIYKPLIEKKEKETIKKEFVKSLNELYPDSYSIDPNEWFYKDGKPLPMKVHYDNNHFEVMIKNTLYYKSEIEEIKAKKLEEAKKLKEENLEKDQLLVQKDQLILTKELEKQELKKEMLAQKEVELANKSLVKNQFINELQGELGLKEKDALNLKIESLMKQLEFKAKEVELKDKALEDAHEIAKQKQIVNELKEKELADARAINELQGKLLDLKALYAHDISFAEEFSAIQFQAENNIANNDFGAIQDLSRYISELLGSARENAESIEISKLLALNESPIVHDAEENHVQQDVPVINNFVDINNIHTTHSVLVSMSGEGSQSYEIVDTENFH